MFKDITQVTQQQGTWKNTNVRKPFAFYQKFHTLFPLKVIFLNPLFLIGLVTHLLPYMLELSELLGPEIFWQDMNSFIHTYFLNRHQNSLLRLVILIKISPFYFFFFFCFQIAYKIWFNDCFMSQDPNFEYQLLCCALIQWCHVGPDLKWPYSMPVKPCV